MKKKKSNIPPKGDVITAYVTRYALTRGILEVQGRVEEHRYLGSIDDYSWIYPRSAWKPTLDEAIEQAQAMAKKRIEKLKKELEFLRDFEPKVLKEDP
jgi:transcription initiation factor IIE alpha subunit